MKNCPYSLSDGVPQKDDGLPVRCPHCGATRKRERVHDLYKFPLHAQLNGPPGGCIRWQWVDGKWQIAGKG